GISGMEKTSYLSKNIDGYLNNDPYTGWNDATLFRSCWGKSYNYDKALAEANLSYTDYASAEKTGLGIHYGYETTAALSVLTDANGVLDPKRTPNYIIIAEVQALDEETGEWGGLDLIEYRGTYYTYDQFQRVALARAKANGVEFFTRVQSGTVPDDSEGAEEGATKPVYDYTGLEFADYTFDFVAANKGTGTVDVTVTGINENKTELWQKVNGEWVSVDDPIATMNEALKAITDTDNNGFLAYAFNGGAMFYNVPIEHSQGLDNLTPGKVESEGVYGVVRNHWYQLSIGKVMGLGHGVFQPGDEENPGEPIIPDTPDNDRYALGANINILSWKIVKQHVDL
ncbi:MAG: fimbria major subunit, partial [Muribaculaceae bacterium]|nr:fimbria major subunit [Muribaculaceae bacterium]